jgi:cellulose synthase/poly-beta-1,6-N-acetylglucosamine synthase-like glycosyltransferase
MVSKCVAALWRGAARLTSHSVLLAGLGVLPSVLSLCMLLCPPSAAAFTLSMEPREAPVALTQTVGQAALDEAADDSQGTALQSSDALSVHLRPDEGAPDNALVSIARWGFVGIVLLLCVYTLRHWVFTMNRLYGRTRAPYVDIVDAQWPAVTVFIAAHNEEAVIAGCLEALLDVDYPLDRLKIVPVNDRSKDRTREIIDEHVARFPGRIQPFHRTEGKPGKAAALKDAMAYVEGDIVLVFDADYIPGRGLLKQLVAPFFDPEVGAVMGRVVPMNAGANLLTRLLDLERSAGYQVDQQARMNLKLVPQYGGTVGGIRCSALEAAGGWHDDILAEDTDMTYRLLLKGWQTVYQNRSECYEEVPQNWSVRIRQIKRWSKGHNQAMMRHFGGLVSSRRMNWYTKLDGILLLILFAMPSVLALAAVFTLVLYFANVPLLPGVAMTVLAAAAYGTLGNFAAFFQIAAAVRLDGRHRRLRLLPFNVLGFVVSATSIADATWDLFYNDWWRKREMVWDKTVRYRQAPSVVAAGTVTAPLVPLGQKVA